jgi:excisionase family DNA binding protein
MTTELITCTIDDAVRISGISRSRIYQLIDDDKLTSTKIGNRRLVFVSSLRALLEQGHPEPVMPAPAKYAHKSAKV